MTTVLQWSAVNNQCEKDGGGRAWVRASHRRGYKAAQESTRALKAQTIDAANTALAVAYTQQGRLAACEALIAAAQAEAQRLRHAQLDRNEQLNAATSIKG